MLWSRRPLCWKAALNQEPLCFCTAAAAAAASVSADAFIPASASVAVAAVAAAVAAAAAAVERPPGVAHPTPNLRRPGLLAVCH